MSQIRDIEIEKKPESGWSFAFVTCTYMLLTDLILYGSAIPLAGTYLAGNLVKFAGWSPFFELLLTIAITVILVYLAFQLFGEPCYWKHLFAFERAYFRLLQVRDMLNLLILFTSLFSLFRTIELMVQDRGMKTEYVSEGTGYFFVKKLSHWFGFEREVLNTLNLKLPLSGSLGDPNFGENERYERGGAFMLYWAMLAASIAKLLYFNTLFTYLRAMEIFMSLKPTFNDDEEYDDLDTRSMGFTSSTVCRNEHPSRLENDYTRAAVKNATMEDN